MTGFAIGCGIGSRRGATPTPTPAPEPVTVQFDYADVADGWTLLTDAATTAGKHYAPALANQHMASIWSGWITGTDAKVAMQADFNYLESDLLDIQVDGGAWSDSGAADASGEYALFSGLADEPHFVSFRVSVGNDLAYMATGADVLRVTGASPAVAVPSWSQIGDTNPDTVKPNGLIASATASTIGAGRTPLLRPAWFTAGNTGRTGEQSLIALRTASSELWVVGQVRYVFVYDGATLTVHDTGIAAAQGQSGLRVSRITGLAGVETTYWVYGSAESGVAGPWFAVGVPAGESLAALDMPVAHLWGDSITEGTSGDTGEAAHNLNSGYVDAIRAFANAGYAPGNFGIAGTAWADYQSGQTNDIAGHLAFLTVTASDVAYVALGTNGTPAQAEVEYVLGQLLAAGYGKVIVRGVLPAFGDTGDAGSSARNAAIKAGIAAVADGRVRYIDPLGEDDPTGNPRWSDVAVNTAGVRPDAVHFVPGGYALLLAHMNAALPGALA